MNAQTTNYTLDLNAGLTQVLSDGTNFYVYGLGRVSQFELGNNTPEYFLTDALGSVRQLTHESSSIVASKSYDPYGNTLSSTGSVESVFGYTGEQTDPSGMVYLRARYYSSGDGRFLTKDTWMGDYNNPLSLNRWMYVEGNPINLTDPSGHDGIPDWVEKRLEEMRITTKQCYENGDTRCVWMNYRQLALFAPYFGLPNTAAHMNRYLFKMGDIYYYGGLPPYPNYHQAQPSKWIFGNSFVRRPFRQETKEMWRKIHLEVLAGKNSGDVTTQESSTGYPYGDLNLYYALGDFYVSISAHYEVSGCEVTVQPKYRIHDTYDWHPGLPAGGGVGGLAGFQDAWAASLKPQYAKEFEIFGVWVGPNKTYRFNSAWFFDWPASRNVYESWEYADSNSRYVDILRLDD